MEEFWKNVSSYGIFGGQQALKGKVKKILHLQLLKLVIQELNGIKFVPRYPYLKFNFPKITIHVDYKVKISNTFPLL